MGFLRHQFWGWAGRSVGHHRKNGAGKSTLLKILSAPPLLPPQANIKLRTRGQFAGSRNRISSLTLTGRENVFLNGAILGMTKSEIRKILTRFVDFRWCGKRYIDTPVKRYSSGMYVRLAFSVAAHLNPENIDRGWSAGGWRHWVSGKVHRQNEGCGRKRKNSVV